MLIPPSVVALLASRVDADKHVGRRIDSGLFLPGRARCLKYLLPVRRQPGATYDDATQHGSTTGIDPGVRERHSRSARSGKREILHDFVHLSVSHRQHAVRVLCRGPRASRMKPRPRRGDDDEARGARTGIRGQRRRAGRLGSAVRRAMRIEPLRLKQFAPGCLEVVFVEHCGGTKSGDSV